LERGWGTRPDGYSLHATTKEAEQYIEDYWEKMPDEVPEEYSRPCDPKLLEVDEKTHEEVQKKRNMRIYQHQIPYQKH
jgi:hypothetical protein